MRGLTSEEEAILRQSMGNIFLDIEDEDVPIHELLTERGLLESWDEQEWCDQEGDWLTTTYWQISPTGRLLLQIVEMTRITIT